MKANETEFVIVIVSFLFLNTFDMVITKYGLEQGFKEANPIFKYDINQGKFLWPMMFKLAINFSMVLAYLVYEKASNIGKIGLTFSIAMSCGVLFKVVIEWLKALYF